MSDAKKKPITMLDDALYDGDVEQGNAFPKAPPRPVAKDEEETRLFFPAPSIIRKPAMPPRPDVKSEAMPAADAILEVADEDVVDLEDARAFEADFADVESIDDIEDLEDVEPTALSRTSIQIPPPPRLPEFSDLAFAPTVPAPRPVYPLKHPVTRSPMESDATFEPAVLSVSPSRFFPDAKSLHPLRRAYPMILGGAAMGIFFALLSFLQVGATNALMEPASPPEEPAVVQVVSPAAAPPRAVDVAPQTPETMTAQIPTKAEPVITQAPKAAVVVQAPRDTTTMTTAPAAAPTGAKDHKPASHAPDAKPLDQKDIDLANSAIRDAKMQLQDSLR